MKFGWGLDGLYVDLNAADALGPFYKIESNTDDALIIRTQDNLLGIEGQQLLGVHQLEILNVTGGAQVDFGVDRVIVNDTANSSIDTTSSVTASPDSTLP